MTLTYIRWHDAVSEEAAAPASQAKAKLAELSEVGFLLDESDDAVCIGMELNDEAKIDAGRWRLHIPKVAIIERRDVELDKAFAVRKRRKP